MKTYLVILLGMVPMRKGLGDGSSRCGPSITACGRPGARGRKKRKRVLWAPSQNTFYILPPVLDHLSAVMEDPQREGLSQSFVRRSQPELLVILVYLFYY